MLRLRQICLVARELAPTVATLSDVFGLATCFHDPAVGVYGLENALLPVGTNFLEVVAPTREGTAAGRYLERRSGDGGYMVILQCDDVEARRARMGDLGVRIANPLNYGDFTGIQLHPSDTGGAMLETDQNEGSLAPDGPWHPAGGDWHDAVRMDRTTAMVGAELQSPDPTALADRWGRILDRPVVVGISGARQIVLDNATLGFVEVRDGRGEGLGGVDLEAADRGAILSAAKARGLTVNDDTVDVCGTRFRLL
ncbi:MAG: VOC family protein [Proteobacteria bacterium]|nr:VOC family protein [Pseudomonadota bacterium]